MYVLVADEKNTCVKSYAFHAPQEVYDILENMQGSKSDYINQCIILATKWGLNRSLLALKITKRPFNGYSAQKSAVKCNPIYSTL